MNDLDGFILTVTIMMGYLLIGILVRLIWVISRSKEYMENQSDAVRSMDSWVTMALWPFFVVFGIPVVLLEACENYLISKKKR